MKRRTYERKVGKRYLSCGWKTNGFGLGFSVDKYLIFVEIGFLWIGLEL